MKKMLNMLALSTMLGLAVFTVGCDDDDDNGGGNNNPPGPTAPASVNGQEITITETGGNPRRFAFAAQGNSVTVYQPGTTNVLFTGTFEYNGNNNTAVLTLRNPDGSNPTTYNMTFTSNTAGTFTYTNSNGQAVTGTFSDIRADTTVPPDNNPPDPNGNTNTPPSSLSGRTLTINATSGPVQGATTYTFTGGTFTSGNSGSGNYTYTLSGTVANLVMDYTAPTDFNGDRDTVVLTYSAGSGTQGTFTGNVRIREQTSDWSGTFQLNQ